ncbi:NAD(+)/NADH kinase [Candidatus Poseidoniaceae archaeon]|jgi:predicted polyphosphate/ATP-dependent NAD kinase|nr:NAD(+)/NADH kinase [Candidatus Poseidoniaceae archaeon]
MRIGIVVNPDAGLGGRLGFKGSDGRAAEARAAGAEDRAGPRMKLALEALQSLLSSSLNRSDVDLECLGWGGRMGGTWMTEPTEKMTFTSIGLTPTETSVEETSQLVRDLVGGGVEAILYAGGDGTTRDIANTLESIGKEAQEIPLIGVPGGVKMHSGCFATTPKAAAEVTLAFLLGDLRCAITEVMDLDEEIYQEGIWKVRMYGEAWTPSSPRFMQGAKEQVERTSESDTIEGLAQHVESLLSSQDDLMVIWGSGGTLRRMGEFCGEELTLLGIDILGPAVNGERQSHTDLNEQQLLEVIAQHVDESGHERPRLLLLSPMGGQGFLIGRGNLQLSPDVLRMIGIENILGVATPAKLIGLNAVRIDTGEVELDQVFQTKRFIKILQGFRTTRLIRIEEA